MAATTVAGVFQNLQPGARLLDGGDLATIIQLGASGKSGLIALAGGGQVGATPIPAYINEFTVVAAANDSALFPPAIAGQEVTVKNSGANALRVYGQASNPGNGNAQDTIVPIAGGGASFITIPANAIGVFSCPIVGRWLSQNQ